MAYQVHRTRLLGILERALVIQVANEPRRRQDPNVRPAALPCVAVAVAHCLVLL